MMAMFFVQIGVRHGQPLFRRGMVLVTPYTPWWTRSRSTKSRLLAVNASGAQPQEAPRTRSTHLRRLSRTSHMHTGAGRDRAGVPPGGGFGCSSEFTPDVAGGAGGDTVRGGGPICTRRSSAATEP